MIEPITKHAVEKARNKLIEREGRVNYVYKDSRGFLTGGIGHLITPADGLKLGDPISDSLIEEWFNNDIQSALRAAHIQAKDLNWYSVDLLAALISVNFQLGPKWHLPRENGGKGFVISYRLLKEGQYQQAIYNLRRSAWYQQTPKRVKDFIEAIEHLIELTTFKEKP